MKDGLKIGVNVTVEVHDAQGRLLHREEGHNLVVTAGRNLIRDALNGTRFGIGLTTIAVGTGNTAVAAGQTALVAQVNTGGISQRTLADGQISVQRFLGTQEANGNTLAEAGLFAGSVMFARYVFSQTVSKTTAATVTVSWSVGLTTP